MTFLPDTPAHVQLTPIAGPAAATLLRGPWRPSTRRDRGAGLPAGEAADDARRVSADPERAAARLQPGDEPRPRRRLRRGDRPEAAQRLGRRGWARLASYHGSRAAKYRHLLDEALGLAPDERALLCVLMLRGPQTLGELKQRTERLHRFADLEGGRGGARAAQRARARALARAHARARRRRAMRTCCRARRASRASDPRAGRAPGRPAGRGRGAAARAGRIARGGRRAASAARGLSAAMGRDGFEPSTDGL